MLLEDIIVTKNIRLDIERFFAQDIEKKELIDNGAEMDQNWRPVKFRAALKMMKEYRGD